MGAFAFIKLLAALVIGMFVFVIMDEFVSNSYGIGASDGITGSGTFSELLLYIWSAVFIAIIMFAVIGGIIESLKKPEAYG